MLSKDLRDDMAAMYSHTSDCINMKARRQALILDLLSREPVRNQEQLRRGLKAMGVLATQATLSRDIKELGLVKRSSDGAYQRPAPPQSPGASTVSALSRAVTEFVTGVDRVQQMIVLRTGPGQAHAAAIAIDRAQLTEVVGTIAGDDTILVITRDLPRARALADRLNGLIGV
jgi:transcriptional regulator of arginine metabolism